MIIEQSYGYAVIVENDVSAWKDKTGELYHIPKKHLPLLPPGTRVIYYKGKLRKAIYRKNRLTDSPYYFGCAVIGESWPDNKSSKGDLFLEIRDYLPFPKPILAKQGDEYLETIPASRAENYWRDGVRLIDQALYERILSLAGVSAGPEAEFPHNDLSQGLEVAFESRSEGRKIERYTSTYERDPVLRQQAIRIHGYDCQVCNFNFGREYGEVGDGYVHVHHLKPLSTVGQSTKVNPETDLAVLCANCHLIIHRSKNRVITLDGLREARALAKSRYWR